MSRFTSLRRQRFASRTWYVLLCALTLLALFMPGCVASKKGKADKAKLEKYVLDSAPADIVKNEINHDNKIILLGYELSPKGKVKPGSKVKLTMYWRVNKALNEKGWNLFTHILDGAGKRILHIDNVGPLREWKGGKQVLSPSDWQAGKVYVDSQSFEVPKKAKTATIQVTSGIWKGNRRLPIKSGNKTRDGRGIVVTLPLGGKSKPRSTRVPDLRVKKLAKGIQLKIDGKLDEPAWQTAARAGPFVDVSTGEAAKDSPVNGSVKVLWSDTALFLGFEVQDADIVGGFDPKQKDPQLWTKDTVEIMIDPDGDGDNKDYYEIQVNPQNLVFDSRFDRYNHPKDEKKQVFGHQDWSAKLKSAVAIDGTIDNSKDKDKGYTVEIQLPWTSFDKAKRAPPKAGDSWRMNFYAMQNNGGVAWSPILRQGNFHKASRFGRVRWLEKDEEKPAPSARAAPSPSAGKLAKQPLGTKPGEAVVAGDKVLKGRLDPSKLKKLPKVVEKAKSDEAKK